jgi:hypothetical protein
MPESKSGHQIQPHNQPRPHHVETEPTSAEMTEVDANGEVFSLKRPDNAVHFADKTLIGDITVVQTKNANLIKNVENERNKTYYSKAKQSALLTINT